MRFLWISRMRTIEIIHFINEEDGVRLDAALSRQFREASRSALQRAIEERRVCVNGCEVTKASKKLFLGDKVEYQREKVEDSTTPLPEEGILFDVLYEDPHLIVVDKPAGLVVHPGAGNPAHTLINGILAKYPEIAHVGQSDRPGIVHRLDAETSGVLLIARSEEAYRELVPMFSSHAISRRYFALSYAPKLRGSGTFDTPYGRHPKNRIKYSSLFDAPKRAITHYEIMARNAAGYAWIRCFLETGRTHQIRVHLSEHGAPILADSIYAPKNLAVTKIIPRLALHARELVFTHPITHEAMDIVAPWPSDILAALKKLGFDEGVLSGANTSF